MPTPVTRLRPTVAATQKKVDISQRSTRLHRWLPGAAPHTRNRTDPALTPQRDEDVRGENLICQPATTKPQNTIHHLPVVTKAEYQMHALSEQAPELSPTPECVLSQRWSPKTQVHGKVTPPPCHPRLNTLPPRAITDHRARRCIEEGFRTRVIITVVALARAKRRAAEKPKLPTLGLGSDVYAHSTQLQEESPLHTKSSN